MVRRLPLALRVAMLALAFSFIVAALLSFRFNNPIVVFIYEIAAVWLGFLNYFFWAACLAGCVLVCLAPGAELRTPRPCGH